MPFCPHCGSINSEGSRFCAECGGGIPYVAPVPTAPPVNTPQPQPTVPPTNVPPAHIPPANVPPVNVPPAQIPTPPIYTPPQGAYPYAAPPAQPVEETPKRSFPWGIVIALLVLALLAVGFLAVDMVTDGELNLFGILSSDEDGRRHRDEDEDEDEDEGKNEDSDSDEAGSSDAEPGIPVPTLSPPSVDTVPPETTCPTEPAVEAAFYPIRIWVSDAIADLTLSQIEEFNQTNPYGIYFDAYVEYVNEADASSFLCADIASGGDLFCFPQDQLSTLVNAGALSMPDVDGCHYIFNCNAPSAAESACLQGQPYAYPMTSDNGYFLYYNKTLLSEEDVKLMSRIITVCEETGTTFCFDLTNAWYMVSFFFGTGCTSTWETDGNGNFTGVTDTFCSEAGAIAAQGMQQLLQSPCHVNSSYASSFAEGAAAVVSGIWNYETALSYLGSDLGVAELPSFEADGVQYHLGSYSGTKLLGVKPQEDSAREEALHYLALYLTSEQCQLERYAFAQWGPSNSNAQQSEDVQKSPALAALLKQSEYAVPQGQIPGYWWNIAGQITYDLKSGMSVDEALNIYYATLIGMLG